MPKEVIYGANQGPDETFVVQVSWSREAEYVQLASKPDLEDLGSGYFVDLDRPGINRLIRHLRRARDQAFGADE